MGLLGIAGCSALPSPPSRPVLYDFGPGPVATAPSDRRAPLPPLALADVEAPGLPEGSNAVLYRLAYADAQQLRPYSQARWSQPPAQLLQQRLREQLGQRRAILKADDGAAQARDAAQGGRLPAVLRVELEEFSHLFASASDSAGVVRLRATVVDLTPGGEALRGQRVFTVRTPARSADAAGGVAALADASTQVAQEVAEWVEQVGRQTDAAVGVARWVPIVCRGLALWRSAAPTGYERVGAAVSACFAPLDLALPSIPVTTRA